MNAQSSGQRTTDGGRESHRPPSAVRRPLPHVAAALTFVALAIAFTWPLTLHLGRAVSDPGDPFINIWILDWDWWATLHQPLQLFHANAFHPAKYSLAYSENLYGLAVLLFPLRMLGVTPIAAYNVAMLAGFAFCGFAAYLLGRRLTGSWIAGMAAGMFYAFVPFRFTHLPHVQFVFGGWLPLLLVALLLYAERPTARRAALFALVFVMNGLTNIHYLLFGAFTIAVTAALLIPRREWKNIGIATGAAVVVLLPFLWPYAAVAKLYGMRTYGETFRFSAFVSDWVMNPAEPERRLFPGFLALMCVVVALFVKERAKVALGSLWIVIGFLGSLGLHFEFHRFLYGAVPGFRAVRVPARWAVIAYIGAAILIALVTAAIARRNRWIALLVPIAFAIELHPRHIRWFMVSDETPPVYAWLAKEGRAPIAEVPLDTPTSEYFYMLRATAHHRPMINGVSGFAPPVRRELSAKWNAPGIAEDFVDKLREVGVKYLIVHQELLGERDEETLSWLRREVEHRQISFVRRFERDWVFAIADGGRRTADGDVLKQWNVFGLQGTTGGIDYPQGTVMRGQGYFSGWAKSPHGIRGVDIAFENGRVRHEADWNGERFVLILPSRPETIRRETDFEVEITDGRGEVTRLPSRWLRWE